MEKNTRLSNIHQTRSCNYHKFEHEVTPSFCYPAAMYLIHAALIGKPFTEKAEQRFKLISVHRVPNQHQPFASQSQQEVGCIKPANKSNNRINSIFINGWGDIYAYASNHLKTSFVCPKTRLMIFFFFFKIISKTPNYIKVCFFVSKRWPSGQLFMKLDP